MSQVRDRTGQTIQGQYIIGRAPSKVRRHGAMSHWYCRCACGRESVKDAHTLNRAVRLGKSMYCTSQCPLIVAQAKFAGQLGRDIRAAKEAEPGFLSHVPKQPCWFCGTPPGPAGHVVTKRNASGTWTQGNSVSTCKRCLHMRAGRPLGQWYAEMRAILDRHG